MKNKFLKLLIILPVALFADWLLMILFGCFAGACKADNKFFCSVYCHVGIALLVTSLLLAFYFVFKKKHAEIVE